MARPRALLLLLAAAILCHGINGLGLGGNKGSSLKPTPTKAVEKAVAAAKVRKDMEWLVV